MTNLRILRSKDFDLNFKRRIKKNQQYVSDFKIAVELFLLDSSLPVLRDHELRGKMYKLRSFSINDEIRVIYLRIGNTIRLIDIGNHDEVYYK